MIIATNPIVISLCAALFFSEPLNLKKIAGLLISVTGAMIVISDGQLDRLLGLGAGRGELLIFGCVISWVAYSIIGKKAMTNLSPLVSVCYSAVAGTLFLLIPALSNGLVDQLPAYGMVEWGSLFYLGFFGTTLGFFWYYEGIKEIGPMRAGMFINFVPVSAIILSFFILGEPLTLSLVIGGGCVISGVLLTNMGSLIKSDKTR